MRSSKTRSIRLATHVTLEPGSTRPGVGVFDFVGSIVSRLLDVTAQPSPVVLTRANRQNCRGKQETGDEGRTEEHSECEGTMVNGWSKEWQMPEAGIKSAVLPCSFIHSAGPLADRNTYALKPMVVRDRLGDGLGYL